MARFWRVSPMEIETWPFFWIEAGKIVQHAEHEAQQRQQSHAGKRR